MISKLLLIRKNKVTSNFTNEAKITPFVKGEAYKIYPSDRKAWQEEDGFSHYAYQIEGLKLDDWKELQDYLRYKDYITVLEFNGDLEASLNNVGLTEHPSA